MSVDSFAAQGVADAAAASANRTEAAIAALVAAPVLRKAAAATGESVLSQILAGAAAFLEGGDVTIKATFSENAPSFTARNPFGVTYTFKIDGTGDASIVGKPS
jgi:hypothetical protein